MRCLCSVAVCLLLAAADVHVGAEFQFPRIDANSACIQYRASASGTWGYLFSSQVTSESALFFCKRFNPLPVVGIGAACYVERGYRYTNLSVDCPHNATSDSNCTLKGSTSPEIGTIASYASITCAAEPMWEGASSFSLSNHLMSGGARGSRSGRTVTVTGEFDISNVKPATSMQGGTLCIPNASLVDGVVQDSNLARALCRTADLLPSANSTIIANTVPTDAQRYLDNVSCSNSSGATLWNGGCSFDAHYYGAASGCSPYTPQVRCPTEFDLRLTDPIVSDTSINGYQLVRIRRRGTGAINDGTMCIDSTLSNANYFANNFAKVMCLEMYGDAADFYSIATPFAFALNTRYDYITSVYCASPNFTLLSQCTGEVHDEFTVCVYPYLQCKITRNNTQFSLFADSSTTTVGAGYLKSTNTAVGPSSEGFVCYDGFNMAAALASCRSVGYAPGTRASFSMASSPSSYAIDNVACPENATSLSDCTLRYVGARSLAKGPQTCSGRVYIDCDVGLPTPTFRVTPSRYLQVRLFNNSDWGWVVVSDVSSSKSEAMLCNKATSSSEGAVVTKSYLHITSCPDGTTSYSDCTYTYTNGQYATNGYHCPAENNPNPSGGGANTGALIVGLSVGGSLFFIVVCVGRSVWGQRAAAQASAEAAQRTASETRGETAVNDMMLLAEVEHETCAEAEDAGAGYEMEPTHPTMHPSVHDDGITPV